MFASGSGNGVVAHGGSDGAGDGGFFSQIGEAVSGTVKEVLPVWTKQQLLNQQEDQLNQSTYNPQAAPRTLFGGQTTGGVRSAQPQPRNILGDISANVDPMTALGLVALVFGGVYLIKKVA